MSWRPQALALALVATAACSDDSSGTPAPDSQVGPDSCCAVDTAVDLPPTDSQVAPDVPAVDLPRPGPDSCCPDLPAVDLVAKPDLAGTKKKLLVWAQCSTSTQCKPYCGAIGSKSEGWYDGCTNQLLKHPLTGSPFWDLCAKCVVTCDAVGTKSEGWYAQCP